MKIISFDCGYKTLSWAIFDADPMNLLANLKRIAKLIDEAIDCLDRGLIELTLCITKEVAGEMANLLCVIEIGQADIIGCKVCDISISGKICKLKQFIKRFPADYFAVIERQPALIGRGGFSMTSNEDAASCCFVLASYFNNFYLIDPKHKSGICFAPHLSYDAISRGAMAALGTKNKANTKRAITKKHTVANLQYYCDVLFPSVSYAHIPKSTLDDTADAFMQGIAFIAGAACGKFAPL